MTTPQPKYDIKTGPLAEIYGLFVPETINTGAQISADRITDASLQRIRFYTANLPLATKRDGRLLLGVGGNAAFTVVFGTDTERVCNELNDTGYIHLSPEQRDLMLHFEKSGEVVFVDPQSLELKWQEAEYHQFPIRTGVYEKDVTVARMPFVSAGYGSGDQLGRVMGNLKDNGRISEIIFFIMSPDHVAEQVKDNEMVARASRLNSFGNNSDFNAGYRNVGDLSALRGVRRGVIEGDAPKSGSTLDTLVGKGTDVGNGLVVVRRDQLSEQEYASLIRRQ